MQEVELKDLTPEQAKQWLVANDGEAKGFWESQMVNRELVTAVWENLRDFGVEYQSGDIYVRYEVPKLHVIDVTYEREDDDTDEDYEAGVRVADEAARQLTALTS